MTETMDEPGDGREHRHEEDELLEEQERKGYGEDEGEREESLPDE